MDKPQTVKEVKEMLSELDENLIIDWRVETKGADVFPKRISKIETEFDFNKCEIKLA